MQTIRTIIALSLIAFAAYTAITFYIEYVKSTAVTTWAKFLDATKGSATILWSRFVIVIGSVAGFAGQAADALGEPSVSSAIQAALKPEYVAAFLVIVSLITIFARKRTL